MKRVGITVSVVLVFGAIGLLLTRLGGAATFAGSQEAENGVIAGAADIVDGSGVSGDGAVKFGVQTTPPTPPPTPPGGSGFTHPGILVGKQQLDFVKSKLAAGEQPWTAAQAKISGTYRNTNYAAAPVGRLDCVANRASCDRLNQDAVAAYTQALLYYYGTGADRATYAQSAIRIMNAWSSTLTSYSGTQAQLQLAWAAETMPRAAEILRYTYTPAAGQASLNVGAFSSMLKMVFVPAFDKNSDAATYSNGNWALSMADGLINIGVFTDDRAVFDSGVTMWRERLPAYIYLASDGASPVTAPGNKYNTAAKVRCMWLAAPNSLAGTCPVPAGFAYEDGMTQETCRDTSHVILGLEAATNAAETAYHQGVNLYADQPSKARERLSKAYEYNAKYMNSYLGSGSWPAKPCGQPPVGGDGGGGYKIGWEIAYNHYAGRENMALPNVLQMVNRNRPTTAALHIVYETLTHAGTSGR